MYPYLIRGADLSRELGIYLIFGFLELDGEDLYNTCAMFDPKGEIIAKHSKVHSGGEAFITPGRELKPFDTALGRIGFLICKDREVQDNFNMHGVQDVDAVIIPMDGSGGKNNTRKLIQRAQDNCCWIVVANTWSAVMIDPSGDVILEKYESECVSVPTSKAPPKDRAGPASANDGMISTAPSRVRTRRISTTMSVGAPRISPSSSAKNTERVC